jgi:hypothetical protein
MTKTEARELLGCANDAQLADALNITRGAISQWPEQLPEHAQRRVESYLYRRVNRGRKHR